MPVEPARSSVPRYQMAKQQNPYQGRWNWWYGAIADVMIEEPGLKVEEIAARLNKHAKTISLIMRTDLFQEFLAQRRAEYRAGHDFALQHGLTKVAKLALEAAAEHLEKKKDQVPLATSIEAMNSALDRLGYAPKTGPQVAVQVNNDNSSRTQTVLVEGVSASALEEARAALRLAETRRGQEFDGLARHSSPALAQPERDDQLTARGSASTSETKQLTLDLVAVEVVAKPSGNSQDDGSSPQAHPSSPSINGAIENDS